MKESKSTNPASLRAAPDRRKLKRRKRAPSEGTVAIIDRLLLRPFSITVNGEAMKLSTAEAIVLQLMQKAISGSGRAWQVLMKYQEFANRHSSPRVELQYVDSEYTQSFANASSESDDD